MVIINDVILLCNYDSQRPYEQRIATIIIMLNNNICKSDHNYSTYFLRDY